MTYNKEDVTIIVPVYNGAKYIVQCIDSCINQAGKIIIIDDASTDNTLEILSKVYGRYGQIHIIHLDKNGGTAKALNVGIANSKTDFIKWVSADDILKPKAIEEMLVYINQYCHIDNRIFYTNYEVIDKDGQYLFNFDEPIIPTEPFDNTKQIATLLDHFYGNGSTTMIHKNVFKKCGLFDETLGYQEDYEFWLRALCLYEIRLTLLPMYSVQYRYHDKQLTALHKGDSLKQSAYIRHKILKQCPDFAMLKIDVPIKTRLKRIAQRVLYNGW